MITTKIVLLGDTHPARLRGYGYSVQIFVKTPGVVAHWEVQHEIDGKAYTEQRILHASVKNPGCIQFSTAHIYPDEYIPVMDSQFKNAADFFRYEAPPLAVVTVEKVA